PAWPSNAWQIYTSDYDTAAAYYGVAKACEPLHAQLNLPDHRPAIINTTRAARTGLTLHSEVLSVDGRTLHTSTARLTAPANSVTALAPLPLAPLLVHEKLVFVRLTLRSGSGELLSRNLYWQARSDEDQRMLSRLPSQPVSLQAVSREDKDGTV